MSLVPAIQGGLGMNFGLPLGVICGLLGSVTAVEFNLRGWAGFSAAIGFSIPLAIVADVYKRQFSNSYPSTRWAA